MNDLGKMIKNVREAKGITYYRLFRDLRLTQQQVESIEQNTRAYTFNSVYKLCTYLGIEIKVGNNKIN